MWVYFENILSIWVIYLRTYLVLYTSDGGRFPGKNTSQFPLLSCLEQCLLLKYFITH